MTPILLFVFAAASATAIPVPSPVISQYHAQDGFGQYTYGYNGGPSSKQETRTIDGITRGAFSYVDSNGLIQSRSYVSDPVNGFRVAASDVPTGHPEAVAVPAVATYSAPAPVVSTYTASAPVYTTYHAAAPVVSTYTAAAPVVSTYSGAPVLTYAAAPSFTSTAYTGTHTQYHSQDALGQYHYGYSGGSSSKDEIKTADGITRGAFSYIDSHGLVQSRSYVADDVNGFRVAASDLPVGPAPTTNVVTAPVALPAPFPVATPVATPIATPIATPVGAPAASPVQIPVEPAAAAPGPVPSPPQAPVASSPPETPASDAGDSVVVDSA